jgi:multisubunit Na+/H+ antiporter MnhG subunit
MSVGDVLVALLLGLGVLLEALAALGLLLARDVFDRLHFLGPATLGSIPIAGAVLVREGPSLIGLKALLVASALTVTSPLLASVIASAARIGVLGDWRRAHGEGVRLERP